jgi:RimJ/RimL family protein N-acetyltransferase
MNLRLEPIGLKEDPILEKFASPECREVIKIYNDYYPKIGYHIPWIGYFVIRDGHVVGCCGFIKKPENGKVEIAYNTFKEFEGQGIATFSCRQLIALANKTDPSLIITAKSAPEHNASTKILQRCDFVFTGIVQDHDIGDAWEWTLQ